jgi:signal transduction histidine kinase
VLASHLRAHGREAEAALQGAYAELAASHQELLEVDRMRTRFLANVSHELRTPLSSIRAISELLLTYDDPAVRREFLQIVNDESERLTRLINDVLDATRIESGQVEWHVETVDVAALVDESARTFAPLIERQGLAFELDIAADLPPVSGDRDRLNQVVGNLLGNAVKFTPQGRIRLSAVGVDGEVRVAVADTGIGVAAEDQARIFEKFQQVSSALTGKPRGTGLGLAICQEIIAHHKGRLWVKSEPGRGSTFTFALAAAPRSAAPARPAPRSAAARAGRAQRPESPEPLESLRA